MEAPGGNADLRAKAKLATIGKLAGGVVNDDGAVDFGKEPVGHGLVGGHDCIGVARGVRSGVLSVNSSSSVHLQAPFGGFKQSGLGRELGMHAMEHYTELKNVYFETT